MRCCCAQTLWSRRAGASWGMSGTCSGPSCGPPGRGPGLCQRRQGLGFLHPGSNGEPPRKWWKSPAPPPPGTSCTWCRACRAPVAARVAGAPRDMSQVGPWCCCLALFLPYPLFPPSPLAQFLESFFFFLLEFPSTNARELPRDAVGCVKTRGSWGWA